ncbi:rCG41475 [Rattus norvegicus]|uniref:RCG41475 n=1 Tax=Rattus norvegicus TaxID=10116 RepID=A6IHS0_RAT|nr:rCG41475 [Rattus norvegicus]
MKTKTKYGNSISGAMKSVERKHVTVKGEKTLTGKLEITKGIKLD